MGSHDRNPSGDNEIIGDFAVWKCTRLFIRSVDDFSMVRSRTYRGSGPTIYCTNTKLLKQGFCFVSEPENGTHVEGTCILYIVITQQSL